MSLKIFRTVSEFKHFRRDKASTSVGFVPTMGALHQGHGSLIEKCRQENDISVASIFVNPTQFNNPHDLESYPRTLEKDVELLESWKVDALFLPDAVEMYPDQYQFKIEESILSKTLCGAHRPGHFTGMLTVVMKLLQIVSPHRAYFGEKDFQQLLLVQKMVETFFMDVIIVPCPIVREADGLAMSSRNQRLTSIERQQAPFLHQSLTRSAHISEVKSQLTQAGFKVDYVEDQFNRRLAAAHLGSVRLIDNIPLPSDRNSREV